VTDSFSVDAEQLAERAGRFAGLAERADRIHRDLAERLGTAGQCWGTDEIGASFAAVHAEPADETLSAMGGLSGKLTDVGDRFVSNASGYAEGELDNVRRFEP
jgi:hypothetical protein